MSKDEQELDPVDFLLQSKFPNIKKMSKEQLLQEVEMWRNIWAWIPSEVKYYVARTGQMIGLTMRNYKRYLGTLLATYWDLTDVELGTYEKVYDQISGEAFYEKKVVKIKISNLVDVQWIKKRMSETDVMAEPEAKEQQTTEVSEENGEHNENNTS